MESNPTTPEEYKAASEKLAEQDKAPKPNADLQAAAASGDALRAELQKMGKRSLRERKLDNRRKMRMIGHREEKKKPRYFGRKIDCAHEKALAINARIDRKETDLLHMEALNTCSDHKAYLCPLCFDENGPGCEIHAGSYKDCATCKAYTEAPVMADNPASN